MKIKRSRSLSPKASSSEENMKRMRSNENENENNIIHPHILNFSDDVLLNMLKFLNPTDLMAISLCSQRLAQVACDKSLWKRVDFRATRILLNDLKKYIRFLHPMTTSLAIRGDLYCAKDAELSPCFFNSIKSICTQLKELIIEEYRVNADKIQITDFPGTIEKLSLEGCKVENLSCNKSYFFKMNFHMPNLTCLILSNCQWFTPHSLLVISKIPNLKELRLNSCHGLGECVAYTSLATRFGFTMLEILDLRDTSLGDSEVGCFNCTKTLTHLYLECPSNLDNDPEVRLLRPELFEQPPVYEDRHLAVQYLVENAFPWDNMLDRCLISDRVIWALRSDPNDRRIVQNSAEGIIIEEETEEDKRVSNNPLLKTLVVRNYPHVTNSSLVHLALNAPSLERLDVSGTSVTKQGVENFKSQRPNVKIVTSFDEI